MATKRKVHSEHYSYLTHWGTMLTFTPISDCDDVEDKLNKLEHALNFDLHHERKGNTIVAYFFEDYHNKVDGELEYLKRMFPKLIGYFTYKMKHRITLNNYLPAYLPKFKCTWEEKFEDLMRSTEEPKMIPREDSTYAVVNPVSINELRTNYVY